MSGGIAFENLLSQLNQRCTSTALIGWGGEEARDVGVAVQETGDGAAQGAGAVPMNDSHLTQTRQRCLIKKLINCVDGFIRSLSDHIQLGLRLLFSSGQLNLGTP